MCVSAKIEEIQFTLMGKEFPKSGFNKFSKNRYHELKDIMPPIVKECHARDLVLFFNFTPELAILDVADKHDVSNHCKFTMPMPKLEQLNSQMNVIQSIGADSTYLKRYLLVNTFLILEDDVADALTPEEGIESGNDKPLIKEKTAKQKTGMPKPISDALVKLDEKGKKITPQTVWASIDKKVFKNNPELRKECVIYIENHIGKGRK